MANVSRTRVPRVLYFYCCLTETKVPKMTFLSRFFLFFECTRMYVRIHVVCSTTLLCTKQNQLYMCVCVRVPSLLSFKIVIKEEKKLCKKPFLQRRRAPYTQYANQTPVCEKRNENVYNVKQMQNKTDRSPSLDDVK